MIQPAQQGLAVPTPPNVFTPSQVIFTTMPFKQAQAPVAVIVAYRTVGNPFGQQPTDTVLLEELLELDELDEELLELDELDEELLLQQLAQLPATNSVGISPPSIVTNSGSRWQTDGCRAVGQDTISEAHRSYHRDARPCTGRA